MEEKFNLTGKKFGKLLVISKETNNKHGKSRWSCKCDCGIIKVIDHNALSSGNAVSCGCSKILFLQSKTIDLIGKKFGRLTVIEKIKKEGSRRLYWRCICDCGKEKIIDGEALRKKATTSCGCYHKEKVRTVRVNRIGNIYGQLTVLKQSLKNDINKKYTAGIYWVCQCSCGGIIECRGDRLHCNKIQSCEQCREQARQIKMSTEFIGHKFHLLQVISYEGQDQDNERRWKCLCECGNTTTIGTSSLKSQQSCGCIQSRSERDITGYLIENNIQFENQKRFPDCKNVKTLPFDFYIISKKPFLIEYNGEQHYKPMNYYGGKEKFHKRQINDRIKQEYCLQNDIPLLIIRYDENPIEKIQEYMQTQEEIALI